MVDMSVPWSCQTPSPIVKDAFLIELVIRDVRNWVFFDPLLQVSSACGLTYLGAAVWWMVRMGR
jgi:hypothetical protein